MKLWPRDVAMEEGTTLVVPALTIGNVPQLAVDLVAATLGFARAAVADHPALLPVACNDAYTSTKTTTTTTSTSEEDEDDGSAAGVLSTAAELLLLPPPASSSSSLHSISRSKTALLQLRAPPAPRRRREWAAALAQFAKERGAARVLLLASADSSHAAAAATPMSSSSSSDPADARHPSFVDVPWRVAAAAAAGDCCDGFEDCFAADGDSADGATAKERWLPMAEDARRLAIRDGSTSAAVLEECRARGVPCAALVALCAEGDNAADAARLAGWLCRGVPQFASLLKQQQQPSSGAAPVEWKTPPSWGSAAFWGSSVDGSVPTLY